MDLNCGVLEIGVYKGKYLSYLAVSSKAPSIGIDVFVFDQRQQAEENIKKVYEKYEREEKFHLFKANTRIMDEKIFSAILEKGGIEKLTFVSIDGDHSCEGVYHDLKLVEKAIAPGGIIAVDDMFSPISPAVSEGFFKYMNTENTSLKPICFSDNKLFLTTEGYDELYQIRLQVEIHASDNILKKRWLDGNQPARIRPFLGRTLLCL